MTSSPAAAQRDIYRPTDGHWLVKDRIPTPPFWSADEIERAEKTLAKLCSDNDDAAAFKSPVTSPRFPAGRRRDASSIVARALDALGDEIDGIGEEDFLEFYRRYRRYLRGELRRRGNGDVRDGGSEATGSSGVEDDVSSLGRPGPERAGFVKSRSHHGFTDTDPTVRGRQRSVAKIVFRFDDSSELDKYVR